MSSFFSQNAINFRWFQVIGYPQVFQYYREHTVSVNNCPGRKEFRKRTMKWSACGFLCVCVKKCSKITVCTYFHRFPWDLNTMVTLVTLTKMGWKVIQGSLEVNWPPVIKNNTDRFSHGISKNFVCQAYCLSASVRE